MRAKREEASVMQHNPQSQVELRDVVTGLWIWRLEHPAWNSACAWEPLVTSTVVHSRGETWFWIR